MTDRSEKTDFHIALAGNPNVGKSTVFNALTGLRQHTGNWTGKTVEIAVGYRKEKNILYKLVDLPGTYSLSAHSAEEEVARDYLLFGGADAVAVVCDATHLDRNLGLVLQILEITPNALLILNLADEAERQHISVDTKELSSLLKIPVIPTSATRGKGISDILPKISEISADPSVRTKYDEPTEQAIARLIPVLQPLCDKHNISVRFAALRLLENDEAFLEKMNSICEGSFLSPETMTALSHAKALIEKNETEELSTMVAIATQIRENAERIAKKVVQAPKKDIRFSVMDRMATSRLFGIPMMLLLLFFVFWLTTVGANAPSAFLSEIFGRLETPFYDLLIGLGIGTFFTEMIVYGLYRTLTWVISVMLPPMAIFFPLFTILEDVGYLPRIAFNLDGAFCKCGACGKQGLTMCMGLGCNAVGVTGARIIDSRRERLLAVLTNSFMPCNGRFPAIIAVATVFFLGAQNGNSFLVALILVGAIALGALATFGVSLILSRTLLKGEGSSFVLELPSYRKPQIGKIIIRSLLDRTIFVLGRAVSVAAPAGVVLWFLSHVTINGTAITSHISAFLEPLGALMGLDGVILLAFLLGLPANEIVLPLCLMLYRSDGILSEIGSLSSLSALLSANGWTWQTALTFIVFMVMHFPCATTLITVKKETGSIGYAVLAFALPTAIGISVCILLNFLLTIFT